MIDSKFCTRFHLYCSLISQGLGVSEIFDSRDASLWYVPMMAGKAMRPDVIIGALDGDQLSR